MTYIPKSLDIANDSDEESLDRAHSYLMERIHLLNEVSCRTRNWSSILVVKQLKFKGIEGDVFPSWWNKGGGNGSSWRGSCFIREMPQICSELWNKVSLPFFHSLLNSYNFGNFNVALKNVTTQLGQHQAYVEMKDKYIESLNGKKTIYSYPDAHHYIIDRLSDMITYRYSLFWYFIKG